MRIPPPPYDCYFSRDRRYRYSLRRIWGNGDNLLTAIMLNPSKANETKLDPTVTRVVKRALHAQSDGVTILNLFALISTYPKMLYDDDEPVGPRDDETIVATLKRSSQVLVAWGPNGKFRGREQTVLDLCRASGADVRCLGLTAEKFPRHPLHVAYEMPFERYQGRFAKNQKPVNLCPRPYEG
jgi:hypothetical protein